MLSLTGRIYGGEEGQGSKGRAVRKWKGKREEGNGDKKEG
jgi:hypothetical protein